MELYLIAWKPDFASDVQGISYNQAWEPLPFRGLCYYKFLNVDATNFSVEMRETEAMAAAGIYRQILPSPPAVEFSSSEGKELFLEAVQNETMEGFFKLISYYQTQCETRYCGLASLSMVLNALAVDPGRKWKGSWRWFDESMLDCCEPLENVKAGGIIFRKAVCLARCAGAHVEAVHASESTLDDFRNHVIRCSSAEDVHVIVNYNRRVLDQSGIGHFSPIGGYHAGHDMVLILDVARFKYPPHWIPLSLMWNAMNTVDELAGQSRGFMLVSKLQRAPSLIFKHENWVTAAKYLINDVPVLLTSESPHSVPEALSLVFKPLLANAGDFIKQAAEIPRPDKDESTLSSEEKGRLALKELVLLEIRRTELFKHVTNWLSSIGSCYRSDILTVVLLALPAHTWEGIQDANLSDEICALVSTEKLPDVLQDEVCYLHRELNYIKKTEHRDKGTDT